MELPTYFADFVSGIRLTESQVDDLRTGHETLRRRLGEDAELRGTVISTFLQGSYRRATAIRPVGDTRADVDVIVVTNLSHQGVTPTQAIQRFLPFLDKYYPGKYRPQGRSVAIELSYVDIDFVVTAAPSEAQEEMLKSYAVTSYETPEDTDDWSLAKSWLPLSKRSKQKHAAWDSAKADNQWKAEPLLIPDRDTSRWQKTHPIAQIQWTWDKNRRCKDHYVTVVKAIKWWHRNSYPKAERPKGYPLEHMIGTCCPDSISSVAEGLTRTMEAIVSQFSVNAAAKQTPWLPDRGIADQNVMERLSGEDFATFYAHVKEAAATARLALDSPDKGEAVALWRKLLGEKFPAGDEGTDGPPRGGFSPRAAVSTIKKGRFAT